MSTENKAEYDKSEYEDSIESSREKEWLYCSRCREDYEVPEGVIRCPLCGTCLVCEE